jgi:phage gp16-like protein
MAISKQQKAVIHVAKSQLHMADEDYRAMLQRAAGASSSNELDDAGFDKVMGEFERLGFRRTRQREQDVRREGMATPKQLGRIRALWKAFSGSDDVRLGKWLEKHFHVSSVRFVKDWQAGKVVAVLEKMAAWSRAKREREATAQGGGKA